LSTDVSEVRAATIIIIRDDDDGGSTSQKTILNIKTLYCLSYPGSNNSVVEVNIKQS
jgi:hypothetical protein